MTLVELPQTPLPRLRACPQAIYEQQQLLAQEVQAQLFSMMQQLQAHIQQRTQG